MQRLQTRAQFQAVLGGRTIARTRHFALHRASLPLVEVSRETGVSQETLIGQKTVEKIRDNNSGVSVSDTTGYNQSGPAANGKPLFAGNNNWLGAMTPKRWAKRAVTRNAIKRQIYQASTNLNFQPPPAAYIVRLAAGFDKAMFPSATSQALKTAVRLELAQLFEKAGFATRRGAPA